MDEMIQVAWTGMCQEEDNWFDVQGSRLLRLFYTVKCIICIKLNRQADGNWFDGRYHRKEGERYLTEETVLVATFDERPIYGSEYGDGASWERLEVGRGFFYDWLFYIQSDGYP